MSISKAIRDAGADIYEDAERLLNLSPTPDDSFIAFVAGFGDMNFLPFELPVSRAIVSLWQKGQHLPTQPERRLFLEHVRGSTHPSLL